MALAAAMHITRSRHTRLKDIDGDVHGSPLISLWFWSAFVIHKCLISCRDANGTEIGILSSYVLN